MTLARAAETAEERRGQEPPRESFASQVRDALGHLYDPAYLQTHPLARFLPEESASRRSVLG